jgi:cell division transport system permease protein
LSGLSPKNSCGRGWDQLACPLTCPFPTSSPPNPHLHPQRRAERLSAILKAANIDATVDDHIVWSKDVKRATDSAGLVALIAVGLLGATGLAVIAFATHATLLARRDIVELLHLTGRQGQLHLQPCSSSVS